MTLEEAKKVAASAGNGYHGECADCYENFVIFYNEAFPEFVWSVVNDNHDIHIKVEPRP